MYNQPMLLSSGQQEKIKVFLGADPQYVLSLSLNLSCHIWSFEQQFLIRFKFRQNRGLVLRTEVCLKVCFFSLAEIFLQIPLKYEGFSALMHAVQEERKHQNRSFMHKTA